MSPFPFILSINSLDSTQRNGIFVIIPHPSFFTSAPLSTSPPTVLRAHTLNDPFDLESITCLQMTQTGLFVNWSPIDPSARYAADYTGTRRTHEDMFWSGLDDPLVVDRRCLSSLLPLQSTNSTDQLIGDAFIMEEDVLLAGTLYV